MESSHSNRPRWHGVIVVGGRVGRGGAGVVVVVVAVAVTTAVVVVDALLLWHPVMLLVFVVVELAAVELKLTVQLVELPLPAVD